MCEQGHKPNVQIHNSCFLVVRCSRLCSLPELITGTLSIRTQANLLPCPDPIKPMFTGVAKAKSIALFVWMPSTAASLTTVLATRDPSYGYFHVWVTSPASTRAAQYPAASSTLPLLHKRHPEPSEKLRPAAAIAVGQSSVMSSTNHLCIIRFSAPCIYICTNICQIFYDVMALFCRASTQM